MTSCRCCVFLTIFTLSVVFGKSFSKHVGLVKVDPIRATGDSLAGHLCGLVSTRPLSSVSGLVLDFEGRVFALPRARLFFDIEAYCLGPNSPICQAP
ncbi:unnamed protein product [Effrenium voratum]|nr:unnamed protein product [Effrenium voratum]